MRDNLHRTRDRKTACRFRGIVLLTALTLTTATSGAKQPVQTTPTPSPSREQVEFFEKKVRPILADNCHKCHSESAGKNKGGLTLDSAAGLLKGGNSGPAVVPGKPEASLLIKAVGRQDPQLKMPPKDKLAEEQVATLRQWVKLGAP